MTQQFFEGVAEFGRQAAERAENNRRDEMKFLFLMTAVSVVFVAGLMANHQMIPGIVAAAVAFLFFLMGMYAKYTSLGHVEVQMAGVELMQNPPQTAEEKAAEDTAANERMTDGPTVG